MKHKWLVYTILLHLFIPLFTAHAAKSVNIGMIIDGQTMQGGWTPQQFKTELKALTKGEFVLRYPPNSQLDGKWTADRIEDAFKQLQNDPDVDIVITLGYVSSAIAILSSPLRKPTFAPFVLDANLLGVDTKGKNSGIKNLNFISGKANFARDLETFRSVVKFNKLSVLIDSSIYAALPGLIQRARDVAKSGGVELQFILQNKQDEDLASKLPADIEAVVVTSLPRLSLTAMKQLIATLIKKRLPSYSFVGSHLVVQGLLMAEAPASDWQRLARRNALNIYAVLKGETAQEQPTKFKGKRRLILNMATARAIGISPRFDVLNRAVLLNEDPKPRGPTFSLTTVATDAVRANLDLRAAEFALQSGQSEVDEAHSRRLPQISADIGYLQINDDNVAVKTGVVAERSTKAAISLNQIIYSDSVAANVEIQRYLQSNREALYKQLELDIIQDATLAYLNVLKAQTFVQIRQQNMKLTRSNLRLAEDRQRIGVGTPAEVYRWQSVLAGSRQELLFAKAQLQQTRDSLNRLLHRPFKATFVTTDTTLDDPDLMVSRKELFEYINNDRAYALMGDFMVEQALAASPELASQDTLIAANKRSLKTFQRSYWSPTLIFQGEVTNVLDEDRTAGISIESDTDWILGLNVSLPLFEGGARTARVSGSRLTLQQSNTQRDAIAQAVEQRVRAILHQIKASYPSIELSKEAATAARKNFELVTDAYSRGANSILDLLDAQRTALVDQELATNAVYIFLIDLMNLERSLGQFDFFIDNLARDDWLKRLNNYVATEGQDH